MIDGLRSKGRYCQLSKILGIASRIPTANILTVSKDIKNIKRVNMLTVSYWGNAILKSDTDPDILTMILKY